MSFELSVWLRRQLETYCYHFSCPSTCYLWLFNEQNSLWWTVWKCILSIFGPFDWPKNICLSLGRRNSLEFLFLEGSLTQSCLVLIMNFVPKIPHKEKGVFFSALFSKAFTSDTLCCLSKTWGYNTTQYIVLKDFILHRHFYHKYSKGPEPTIYSIKIL